VNLWGVIHGVRTFVPIMLRQGTAGHIVNTASTGGLVTGPFLASYIVSKHGVVALSEVLSYELAQLGAPVKVSVLCPAVVRTNLMDSARNRPPVLTDSEEASMVRAEAQSTEEGLRADIEDHGMSPARIADDVVGAIRADKFYILAYQPERSSEEKGFIRARMEGILEGRNPEA
jgi:short-subunit dehydrogenase